MAVQTVSTFDPTLGDVGMMAVQMVPTFDQTITKVSKVQTAGAGC